MQEHTESNISEGMKYKQISKLDEEELRRLTGVKRKTFEKIIEILIEEEAKKKAKGGMEDRLLMALPYLFKAME
ncbi:putative transposase [Wolbachia endosymbiont of Cylisticus convexus]|nr:putative transposase [Wolbachia endosymbiont of Cylisticus convexus]